ncbi:hypothetical protein RUM44_001267 [Polyplax serrata]|uniref:Alpha-1,6-mannosyl-glycoprotein 2-beta-N-acetylglucosaminyltransferase n=1 Tax=Polyplax serrata TaxID=468196 RepID=A0ABR1AJI8_POLSC
MHNGRLRVLIPAPAVGKRRSSSYLRTFILSALVLFIWLQLNISSMKDCDPLEETSNDSIASIFTMVPKDFHKYLKPRPRTGNETLDHPRPLNISEIVAEIKKYNEMQYVHNEDVFGALQNDSLIVVIQVHERISYLRHLIVSLGQARDIDSVLLVFSHDYFDVEINDLVQSIDFCKVLQIFYPYSIQTHPNVFPGPSPGDCPRDMNKNEALIKKCINARWPDLYGHYREAKFTQTKHHWWWKANRVFTQLGVTRHHTGLVLFLEEDHYVAEDFIYLLRLMQETARNSCPQCDVYSLGTYQKTYVYYGNSRKVGFLFFRFSWSITGGSVSILLDHPGDFSSGSHVVFTEGYEANEIPNPISKAFNEEL